MCKHQYDAISDRTGKTMIFCKLMGTDNTLEQLCVSQRYCSKKDRYIRMNQVKDCKYFEIDPEFVKQRLEEKRLNGLAIEK